MTYFAKIQDLRVVDVVQATQEQILSGEYGDSSLYIECEPQHPNRKFKGIIGDVYLNESGIFVPPKPFESWILHEDLGTWIPPHFAPNDDQTYQWSEELLDWVIAP